MFKGHLLRKSQQMTKTPLRQTTIYRISSKKAQKISESVEQVVTSQ